MINAEEYDEQAVMKELESTANYAKMYSAIQIRIIKILEAKAEEKKAISEAGSEGSTKANLKLPKMELPCFDVVLNARRQNTFLDRLYDEISAYIQSLESLNITSEYLEVFLSPLVESCLPTQILQVWQRTPEAGYGRDDDQDVEQGKGNRLKALMSFLQAEVKAQQRINFSRIGVCENNPKPNFPSRQLHSNKNNGSTATQLYVSKNKKYKSKGSFLSPNYERKTKCIFCDKIGHENWKCFKIGRMTR
ncbi:hypothetical protein LAZ67_7001179 [Cordylochernes scorpioides]|uniref:Gag protein n=1 Tax=Cordylochernes scorpioides TaxID=51811 RepID=A0ABY6KNY9_9ARAC|nr:hypothetical protein LAZ67_7001179 [Cordylochernes scorpioides]